MVKETLAINPTDWRLGYAQSLISAIGALDIWKTPNVRSPFVPLDSAGIFDKYISPEALRLPPTQRLNGKAQNDWLANRTLGLKLTRGGHTEDVMLTTALFLTYLSQESPEIFASQTELYGLNKDDLISHAVEVARLHDILTLSFAGPLHKRIMFAGDPYDEDDALLGVLDGTEAYKFMAKLVFDEKTDEYYQTKKLEKSKVGQIITDAIHSKSLLGQIIKGKRGADWIAYTSRDFSEIMRVFNIDPNLLFFEAAQKVVEKLYEYEATLTARERPNLPEKIAAEKVPITNLVSLAIMRLDKHENKPVIVYDARSLLEVYLKHMILRLFFSGSSWRRGHDVLIRSYYAEPTGKQSDELIHRLLRFSEEELLRTDLAFMFPPNDPEPDVGWRYTTIPQPVGPEKFEFKEIDIAVVEHDGKKMPVQSAFPQVFELIRQREEQPHLYLMKQ